MSAVFVSTKEFREYARVNAERAFGVANMIYELVIKPYQNLPWWSRLWHFKTIKKFAKEQNMFLVVGNAYTTDYNILGAMIADGEEHVQLDTDHTFVANRDVVLLMYEHLYGKIQSDDQKNN